VAEIPQVSLTLANRAENVLLVRQALSGLAETVGLDPVGLNDMSTAVSEACNNVVVHAYRGERGPLEVDVFAAGERIEVVVRDFGDGIHPHERELDEIAGGIGLPVIHALSDSVEFRDLDGSGTEVRMRFAAAPGSALLECMHDDDGDGRQAARARRSSTRPGSTSVAVGPPLLARAVLPRVLCALAARADFSTDRISDTQLLADALAGHRGGAGGDSRLAVQVSVAPRELHVRVGPLPRGAAADVLAGIDGVGSLVERLADGCEVSSSGAAEVLELRLLARA